MTQPIQTHISYSAMWLCITRQPAFELATWNSWRQPSTTRQTMYTMSCPWIPNFISHTIIMLKPSTMMTSYYICFGFFNWDVFLQRLELKGPLYRKLYFLDSGFTISYIADSLTLLVVGLS
jgi:hypothetical protein